MLPSGQCHSAVLLVHLMVAGLCPPSLSLAHSMVSSLVGAVLLVHSGGCWFMSLFVVAVFKCPVSSCLICCLSIRWLLVCFVAVVAVVVQCYYYQLLFNVVALQRWRCSLLLAMVVAMMMMKMIMMTAMEMVAMVMWWQW